MNANWEGQDPGHILRYWAGKLEGISDRSIGYALDNLPKHPPTVDEFREVAYHYRPPEKPLPPLLTSPSEIENCRKRSRELAMKYGNHHSNNQGEK